MRLGVAGAGVVGGTLISYLESVGHTVIVDDPPKEMHGDLSTCEAIFICVPVPTAPKGVQDVTYIKAVLKKYPRFTGPIYIRSSVLPKTCDHLRKFFKKAIYAMPEFLTARKASESFREQAILCGVEDDPQSMSAQEDRLKKMFPDKEIILVSNREAELAKYAHNVMGAIKVNFFNLIAKYCEKIGARYENVREGFLLSGYINAEHTAVPGPDGKYGFGGTCFPKDTAAFIQELKRLGLQYASVEAAFHENGIYRAMWGVDLPQPRIEYPKECRPIWHETATT
jgi:UDP-glucose 6-dehydrogenase